MFDIRMAGRSALPYCFWVETVKNDFFTVAQLVSLDKCMKKYYSLYVSFFDAQFLDAAVFDAEICRVSWDKFEA